MRIADVLVVLVGVFGASTSSVAQPILVCDVETLSYCYIDGCRTETDPARQWYELPVPPPAGVSVDVVEVRVCSPELFGDPGCLDAERVERQVSDLGAAHRWMDRATVESFPRRLHVHRRPAPEHWAFHRWFGHAAWGFVSMTMRSHLGEGEVEQGLCRVVGQ